MTTLPDFITSSDVAPFQLSPLTNPYLTPLGPYFQTFAVSHPREGSFFRLNVLKHESLSLAYPGFNLMDLAWIQSGSLKGLEFIIDRLLSGAIPTLSYQLSEKEAERAKKPLKERLIPKLRAGGFEVFLYEEAGILRLYAASNEPLGAFYTLDFIQVALEWRAKLWNKPFDSDYLNQWRRLLSDYPTSRTAGTLFRLPESDSDVTVFETGDWILADDSRRRNLHANFFPAVMDARLFEALLLGYPLEFAMGELYCQFLMP